MKQNLPPPNFFLIICYMLFFCLCVGSNTDSSFPKLRFRAINFSYRGKSPHADVKDSLKFIANVVLVAMCDTANYVKAQGRFG